MRSGEEEARRPAEQMSPPASNVFHSIGEPGEWCQCGTGVGGVLILRMKDDRRSVIACRRCRRF